MRINSKSKSGAVAGALAGTIRDGDEAILEAIGVVPNYVAVKAIVIASRFLESEGIIPVTKIRAEKREIGDEERTTVVFTIRGEKNAQADRE